MCVAKRLEANTTQLFERVVTPIPVQGSQDGRRHIGALAGGRWVRNRPSSDLSKLTTYQKHGPSAPNAAQTPSRHANYIHD